MQRLIILIITLTLIIWCLSDFQNLYTGLLNSPGPALFPGIVIVILSILTILILFKKK